MGTHTNRCGSLLYTTDRTRALLAIRAERLVDLRERGIIPSCPVDGNRYLYDGLQVDYMAGKLRLAESHGNGRWDSALAELCYLQQVYESCPPGVTQNVLDRHAASVQRQCRKMVAKEQAATIGMLAEQLAAVTAKATIEKWGAAGKIATVKIGRVQYLSTKYYHTLIRLMTKYIPLFRAAEELGCDYDTLLLRTHNGRLSGLRGPDGTLRISPASLARLKELKKADEADDNLTIEEAAAELNVETGTLRTRISEGIVESVGFGPTRRIPGRVVEAMRAKRVALNPGFEWLDANIAFSGRPPSTFTARRTYTDLGVTPSTLTVWSQANLLPYYVRTLAGRHDVRDFVAQYVRGLVRFADGSKVSRQQATEYRRRCTEARVIV